MYVRSTKYNVRSRVVILLLPYVDFHWPKTLKVQVGKNVVGRVRQVGCRDGRRPYTRQVEAPPRLQATKCDAERMSRLQRTRDANILAWSYGVVLPNLLKSSHSPSSSSSSSSLTPIHPCHPRPPYEYGTRQAFSSPRYR